MHKDGRAFVGFRISQEHPRGEAVPLTISRSAARLSLKIIQTLELDPERRYLTTTKSAYTIASAGDGLPVLTYDYVRVPTNQYPAAHLHVHGDVQRCQHILNICGHERRRPVDLHLPVGGRRFRPSLEDLIEFCILEDLVTPRPDWHKTLEASRTRFHFQQLRAMVRRDPDTAAEELRDIGWTSTAPSDT